MAVLHVVVDSCKNCNLEEGIEVGEVDETGDEEHRGAGVVRQDVGVLHQRQTLHAESLTEEVTAKTVEKYKEAYELLTGKKFA